jgi:hypothetical protein
MDGAELLHRLSLEFPASGRILLSGQAEESAIRRAMSVAHELLGKPCPLLMICASIERVDALARGTSPLPAH